MEERIKTSEKDYYDTIWELNIPSIIVNKYINKRHHRILSHSFYALKGYVNDYYNIKKDLLLCFDHYYIMKRFYGIIIIMIIVITSLSLSSLSLTSLSLTLTSLSLTSLSLTSLSLTSLTSLKRLKLFRCERIAKANEILSPLTY